MYSYAQFNEDVYAQRCFAGQERGFYIDIGAFHPVHCSVTMHFYERGWNGVNCEPVPFRHSEISRARPRDINLPVVVGSFNGSAQLSVQPGAEHLASLVAPASGADALALAVESLTLASLCDRYAPARIDFLKIDVEGAEAAVIAGGNWSRHRPALVIVEAVTTDGSPAWAGWEPQLIEARYRFAHFDGVNRYYVAIERSDLLACFHLPANPFDHAFTFHTLGNPLDDRRHPDHAWCRNFADLLLAAAALESDDHLLQVMTRDLHPQELAAPLTASAVGLAFRRVLARDPDEPTVRHYLAAQGLTLEGLFSLLLQAEEFRTRRSRVSVASVWRERHW